jgi:RNA 2',3'-cyclic 3'-phosphodiesterase
MSRFSAPRLFVAIRFADEVNDALDELVFESRGIKGASWTPSEQYHLTLRFIGDPGFLNLGDIDRALCDVRGAAFSLNLKGTGHFPLRGDPETLWVGVDDNPVLSSLRNRVESALTRAGLQAEGRKFHPHVTLANVKAADARDVGRFQVINGLFRLNDIPVTEFLLCSSVLREGGAVHTVEERYPLEGVGIDER